MKTYIYLFAVCFFVAGWSAVNAQDTDLPRYMTEEEKNIWPEYLEELRSKRSAGELPETPVRVMGEWEEIQALFITWRSFPQILTQLVEYAVEEVEVYIITENEPSVRNTLMDAGIDLNNVHFLDWPSNSVWIRDYGPWAVYENDVEQLAISDYIYNRPRPNDDAIPGRVAELFDVPWYAAVNEPYDLVHTGGNNLVDGYKKGYSSEIVLRENPVKTEDEIDYIASRLFGYEEYVKMTELPFDGISHLDMHIRFIDEETLIVGEYPEGVADGPQIEENIEVFLNNHSSSFGNPYEIIRIPMPPGPQGNYPDQGGPYRTFTNSIFLNGTIVVPIYEEQYDTVGLRIYEESLPGYNVVGIDCNAMINSFGALHCITKTVGVEDPLWIAHPRVRDQFDETNSPEVRAKVKHRDGIESVYLNYKTSQDTEYTEIPMEPTQEDWYAANLPAMEFGSEVQYYIRAVSMSGKQQKRPIVAPEGYFGYEVIEPESAPTANFSSNIDEPCPGSSIRFLDRSEGGVIERQWFFDGGTPETSDLPNPIVRYDQPGNYDILLVVENHLGRDSIWMENFVHISEGGDIPYPEDFVEGLDQDIWTNRVSNENRDFEWTVFDGSNCGNDRAIRVDNFNNDNRGINTTLTADFDLTEMEEPRLYFSYAYAPFSEDFGDALEVMAETCDGETNVLFNASGLELATSPPTGENPYTPEDCSEWTNIEADLSEMSGENIRLTFTNRGGWGNFLYLDRIFIKDAAVENQAPLVEFSNPAGDTIFESDFPVNLPIEIKAEDLDGFVNSVDLTINGISVANFDRVPYEFDLEIEEAGTFVLRAVATDNDGAESEREEITVTADEITSTVTLSREEFDIMVFPNPAGETFYIELDGPEICDQMSWSLLDISGRTIFEHQNLDRNRQKVDINHLSPGLYKLSFNICGDNFQETIIISR